MCLFLKIILFSHFFDHYQQQETPVSTFFETQEAFDAAHQFGNHLDLEPKEMQFLEKYDQAIRKKNMSKPQMQTSLQTFFVTKPKANKEGNEDEN